MAWSPSASPATPSPLSPAEMDLLLARAGLALNPGQMADLVLAWRQLAGLIAAIPRSPALADDQAFVFRLPPPGPDASARPALAKKRPAPKPRTSKPPAKKPTTRKSAKPVRKR